MQTIQIPTAVNAADPFVKPATVPAPQADVRGAASSAMSYINGHLDAAKARAATPVSANPLAGPNVDAGPPVARPAQPLLAPGASAFKPQAPITFGTVPGLTANYAPPKTGTVKAPAVVTSDAANEHIDNMTNTAQTANADIQNAAATKAALAANANAAAAESAKTAPATAPADKTAGGGDATDYDSQINDIISALGGGAPQNGANGTTSADDTQSKIDQVQQDAISTLTQENAIDSQNVQTINDALTQLENGTMPLTPGEQAQVDSIKSSFSGALKDAMTYAQNIQGGMAARDAGNGIAKYSPQMAMADMASAVQMGADKIGKVNSDILSAQSKLTTALQNGDYKTASRLYTQISSGITSRNNEIDKINTSIQNHLDKMQTAALDVAKIQISALTGEATRDATASYHAQQLILSNARLSETERHDAITELHAADGTRTAAERSANAVAQFGAAFVPGAKMADGTATVDDNGYITPDAWKAAIADAPAEGLTRVDFIKAFGSQIYSDNKKGIDARRYGLSPAEVKIINGALPAQQ